MSVSIYSFSLACVVSNSSPSYAHYPTGIVASARVSLGGTKGPVAGRNAIFHLSNQVERKKELKAWQSMLNAKEMNLNAKLADTLYLRKIETALGSAKQVNLLWYLVVIRPSY